LGFTFSEDQAGAQYFYLAPESKLKIGNKTVEVALTDRRFAATFYVRDFRERP
jgi:hypothetical protein